MRAISPMPGEKRTSLFFCKKRKTPFDRLRANGSHLEIIIDSSVHAEPVEA
jgi:hypothetical protein